MLPFSTILTIFDQISYPTKVGFSATSATRQVRQQWFSVCIFPFRLLFGLTGNRPQSALVASYVIAVIVTDDNRQIEKMTKTIK